MLLFPRLLFLTAVLQVKGLQESGKQVYPKVAHLPASKKMRILVTGGAGSIAPHYIICKSCHLHDFFGRYSPLEGVAHSFCLVGPPGGVTRNSKTVSGRRLETEWEGEHACCPLKSFDPLASTTGFVGSHLVDRLMFQGHDVIVIDNLFTGARKNIQHWIGHPHFNFIVHDITGLSLCRAPAHVPRALSAFFANAAGSTCFSP